MGNSNHAETKICIGGVAYNIAVILKTLGNKVGISSYIGDDGEGHSVVSALRKHEITHDAIMRSPDLHTASYNAFHDPKGELLIAAADMHIYHKLTKESLIDCLPKLRTANAWVVDSTFLPDMQRILAMYTGGIDTYVTICSVSEAKHVEPWLNTAKVLFANTAEISVLTDMEIKTKTQIWQALDKLASFGVKTIMATNGPDGVYVYHKGEHLHFPAYPANVICVNGAGDSFAAAVIDHLTRKVDLKDAVKAGLAAASLRLEGKPVNADNISAVINASESVDKRAKLQPGI